MCIPLAVAGALAGAGATIYSVNQQKKAAKAQVAVAEQQVAVARESEAARKAEAQVAQNEAAAARSDEDQSLRAERSRSYDSRKTARASSYRPSFTPFQPRSFFRPA